MAANTVYCSAGLSVAKNSGQSPGAGENTAYASAGLTPEVLEAAEENGAFAMCYFDWQHDYAWR